MSAALQHWRESIREGAKDLRDGWMPWTFRQRVFRGFTCSQRSSAVGCLRYRQDNVALQNDCRRVKLNTVNMSAANVCLGRPEATAAGAPIPPGHTVQASLPNVEPSHVKRSQVGYPNSYSQHE